MCVYLSTDCLTMALSVLLVISRWDRSPPERRDPFLKSQC